MWEWPYVAQNLKYLPSGSSDKKFANPCSVLFQNTLLADAGKAHSCSFCAYPIAGTWDSSS